MDVLINSLKTTIDNINSKKNSLENEKVNYLNIRNILINHDETEDTCNDNKSIIFKEVIVSEKIYISIGYDYYIETSKEQGLKFIEEKLKLIEEVMEEFEIKLTEGNKTLKSLESEILYEQKNEEGDVLMDIREELDEYGNIINSVVIPASKKSRDYNNKSDDLHILLQDMEIIGEKKGQEISGENTIFNEDFENNLRKNSEYKKLHNQNDEDTLFTHTNNFYNLNGAVDQSNGFDNIDDDMSINDISYGFSSLEDIQFMADYSDEDDDLPFIVPKGCGDELFMDQINHLRESKLKKLKQDQQIPKSILKNKRDGKKSGKTVGFAKQLDIYEVENVKHETKNNTFKFSSSYLVPADGELDEDGFDPELFAHLIGAKGPSEVHESNLYQELITPVLKGTNKISKFKQDRIGKEKMFSINNNQALDTTTIHMENETMMNDIIEKETTINDIIERETTMNNIVEKETIMNDIIEKEVIVNKTVEKQINSDAVNMQIVKSNTSVIDSKKNEYFKNRKLMKSLDYPKIKKSKNNLTISDLKVEAQKYQEETVSTNFLDRSEDVFPIEIQSHIANSNKNMTPIIKPIVDFQALNNKLDDMVNAYLLDVYDSDIEHTGTVLENIDDFKQYNKKVEELKNEVKTDIDDDDDDSYMYTSKEEELDYPVVDDIIEHDMDEFSDFNNSDSDYELHPDRLHEQIKLQYHTLKHKILSTQYPLGDKEKEFEPIDEYGNPITISRFKSKKFHMNK